MEPNTLAEHPRPALDTHAGAIRREALRGIVRALDPRRISAVYLWGAFIVVFGLITPDAYLTDVTVRLIFSEGAVTCILALAFLIPLIAGAYDLAIGALMSFSVAIGVYLQVRTGIPPAAGALITVVACGAVGALSGFVIVRLKVNSFIATLGVSQILLAAVLLISENRQMVASFPSSWSDLGLGSVAGVPLVVVYLLVLAAGMWFALEHTRIGRYLFATGGNAEAARLSGVPTSRLLWGSLIASGMVAGLAGVVYNMRVGQFDSTVGPGYLFPAIAAVFLGASQLS
jgi:ribose transport system permease protein